MINTDYDYFLPNLKTIQYDKMHRNIDISQSFVEKNRQKDLFIYKRDKKKFIMNVFPHVSKPVCGKRTTKQSVIKSTT